MTGYHPVTARAIAESAGFARSDADIVTGDALAALDPASFDTRVAEASVFARNRPEQKYAIVDSLRRRGEVVAMAGDGINDAPALSRASIGISMGERATEVARAAADIVLLDDNFGSIVTTVREGRRIYDNLEKSFRYLLAFHVPIVVLAIAVPALGMPLLLLPVHLVWLELVVHPVSALLFEGEPAAPDVMARPPRPPGSPLMPRREAVPAPLRDVPAARRRRGPRDRARRPRAGHPLDRLGRACGRAILEIRRNPQDGPLLARGPARRAEHSRAPRHPGDRGDPARPLPRARTMGDRRSLRRPPPSSGGHSATPRGATRRPIRNYKVTG